MMVKRNKKDTPAPALIGTSGWYYDHWLGPFYPNDLSHDAFLPYYADRLRTVEVNNSFYQLPDQDTLIRWREIVPPNFTFAVKASRYITHMKKLNNPQGAVTTFLNRVSLLEDKLGPILFQLPPHWHRNVERLRSFLEILPDGYRYVFEFRDPTWFDERIYRALEGHNAAFCIYDFHDRRSPNQITTDIVYVRLHGPWGQYQGDYDTETLAGWAGAFSTWTRQGRSVYCYFNNDEAGYAPQNALELQSMLSGKG